MTLALSDMGEASKISLVDIFPLGLYLKLTNKLSDVSQQNSHIARNQGKNQLFLFEEKLEKILFIYIYVKVFLSIIYVPTLDESLMLKLSWAFHIVSEQNLRSSDAGNIPFLLLAMWKHWWQQQHNIEPLVPNLSFCLWTKSHITKVS